MSLLASLYSGLVIIESLGIQSLKYQVTPKKSLKGRNLDYGSFCFEVFDNILELINIARMLQKLIEVGPYFLIPNISRVLMN
jgi:hypothetical protein